MVCCLSASRIGGRPLAEKPKLYARKVPLKKPPVGGGGRALGGGGAAPMLTGYSVPINFLLDFGPVKQAAA
jgi:hypothetical protein